MIASTASVNLKLNNIDVKQKYIQCYGKGSKERIVPFGNKAKNAINKYLKQREIIVLQHKLGAYRVCPWPISGELALHGSHYRRNP